MTKRKIYGGDNAPVLTKHGRICSICNHPKRLEIDGAIVAKSGIRPLATQFGVSEQAVRRHRANHMPRAALVEAAEAREAAEGYRGSTLLETASTLRLKAMSLLAKAEAAGDLKTALQGVREAGRLLEIQARITGEIDDSVHLNVLASPALVELQQVILRAIAPFPEARQAVVLALTHMTSAPLMIEGRAE